MSGYSQENASSLVQSVALVANGASWDPTTGSTNAITKNLFSAECYRIQKEDLNICFGLEIESIDTAGAQLIVKVLVNGDVKKEFRFDTVEFHEAALPDVAVKAKDAITFEISTTAGNIATKQETMQVYVGSDKACSC